MIPLPAVEAGGIAALLLFWANSAEIPKKIWTWLLVKLFVSVSVHGDLVGWLQDWCAADKTTPRLAHLSALFGSSSPGKKLINIHPGVGTHCYWYHRRPLWIEHTIESLDSGIRNHWTVHTLRRHRTIALTLLEEAARNGLRPNRELVTVFTANETWWEEFSVASRLPESVILKCGLMEELLADGQQFLASKDWYKSLGVPYRRGWLFWGPPGNGKSSTVLAIASALQLPIYCLSLNDPMMTDSKLTNLLRMARAKALILLEDVDALFVKREVKPGESFVSFSGLLNALDGVAAKSGRLLIMTTNHPEQIDAALKRPGRTDKIIEFGNADEGMAARLFERFFPTAEKHLVDVFAHQAGKGVDRYSMASLQEYLLLHRENAEYAATAWGKEIKSVPS